MANSIIQFAAKDTPTSRKKKLNDTFVDIDNRISKLGNNQVSLLQNLNGIENDLLSIKGDIENLLICCNKTPLVGTLPTGFTQGSVVFAGPGGFLSEDNANFFWDDGLNVLEVANVQINSLTQNSILFAGPSGLVSEDNTNFTWNNATKTMNVVGDINIDSDTNALYYGESQDAYDAFDGTDLVRDFDINASGTSSYRIQNNGVERLTIDPSVGVSFGDLGSAVHAGIDYAAIAYKSTGRIRFAVVSNDNEGNFHFKSALGFDANFTFYENNVIKANFGWDSSDNSMFMGTSNSSQYLSLQRNLGKTGYGNPVGVPPLNQIEMFNNSYDPAIGFRGTGTGVNYVIGQDRTDSGKFMLSEGTSLGTNVIFKVDSSKNVSFPNDNQAIKLGTGEDMGAYYDGTNGNIDTDLVAPSDLVIDCGTNKTIELEETVWDDLRTPASAVRLGGARPPTETSYKGGQVLAFSSIQDNTMYFNAQLPHKYKQGTDIKFHIHWTIPTSGSGAGAENVKWDFTYSWANIGSTFPAESSATITVDVQNDVLDDHMFDTIVTISGTGKNLSSQLICSLTRDTGVANDYSDDAYIIEVDFHFEIDTIGSRQETAK